MDDIRLLVLDVDGTLTDGGLYLDSAGGETKKFSVRDGAGLALARAAGIRVMILTGGRACRCAAGPRNCTLISACRTARTKRRIWRPF